MDVVFLVEISQRKLSDHFFIKAKFRGPIAQIAPLPHLHWLQCDALQPVDKVSYLPIHWLLALISCRLSDARVISVFSLMLT